MVFLLPILSALRTICFGRWLVIWGGLLPSHHPTRKTVSHVSAPCSCLALAFLLAVPTAGGAQTNGGDTATKANVWSLHCVNVATPAGSDDSQPSSTRVACEASQTVSARQGDQDVEILKLAISSVGEEGGKSLWGLVTLLPLDVLLTSDFGLGADKVQPGLHRYRNCNHLGCFAVVPLTNKLVAGLSRSKQGMAYFRLTNGRVVKVVFPLEGFAEAFKKLSSGKDLPSPILPVGSAGTPEATQ
ncbi:invasion associated locus B family protein [Pleomorphomonas oryzae]|uniref:invasion associated locus B family protein n=1 Tax=Pleomorphomonas oryzae TaxID=261934 RepID=UPI0009FDCAAE|nr:invasion associated locus B family protein [Pleomorphomonas oryzae]